ncbi:MAG TPA: ABC transporter permease [Puia sp.]|jgi:ABC-type antimicrobial peptide transport system permease subunit|nr:ABC transporter permease [Puia sp.]
MLRNFFKIAVRNLWRNKSFSVINILGLAIGMASALLIGLWINNELSFDRFYVNKDRIYQMYSREFTNGNLDVWGRTPSPLAAELKKDYPEVEFASRFRTVYFLLTEEEKHLNLEGAFADSGILSILDFPLLQGNAKTALNDYHGIVLTAHLAKSLFADQDPMGKTVRIDSADNFTVTGVLKDLPTNTQFTFQYLLPWSYVDKLGWDAVGGTWQYTNSAAFVLLKPGASASDFNTKVRDINKRHVASGEGAQREIFAYPITRDHLYDKVENGNLVAGRMHTVRFFILIAVFILVIACINFMNLSTARSERRAREVGIRKVIGALRTSLIAQFIGESLIIATLAFLLAMVIVRFSLPAFDQIIGIPLTLDLGSPAFWLFATGFVVSTGILAGSYPAFFLSAARPVKVLKGVRTQVNALINPRKVLVVLQFTFAIILITCTLIVENQLRYARNRDSGYDKDRLAFTFVQGDVLPHYDAIRHDLLASGAVLSVTKTFSPITRVWGMTTGFSWPASIPSDKDLFFTQYEADADFVKTTGTHLLAGRDIDLHNFSTDSTAALLNETAVRTMRLDHPVGSIITDAGGIHLHVVGVIKDFIIANPYAPVNPMIIRGLSTGYPVIHFRFNPDRPLAADVAAAEKVFRRYNPQYPFECNFVDDIYNAKFRAEQQEGTLGILFTILTIFISCLGLFGLAAYMAESRTREIGIRKVLGASVTGITLLISGEFIKLVVIAVVIATPIAWISMDNWLQDYTYRIHITGVVFLLAGLLAIGIALLTVGYQSMRAALANPVKSLRSE